MLSEKYSCSFHFIAISSAWIYFSKIYNPLTKNQDILRNYCQAEFVVETMNSELNLSKPP